MSGRTAVSSVAPNCDAPTANTKLTRRLNVCISGTLANFFAEGQGAATWKPIDGKQVFIFSNNTDKTDLNGAVNAIKNAYILECKVLEVKSSFPAPVGVMINCIPSMETVETGEKFAFTALPNSYNSTTHTLFTPQTA